MLAPRGGYLYDGAMSGTPSDDLLRLIKELDRDRFESGLWFRLLWQNDDCEADEQTAFNFLHLAIFLVSVGADRYLADDPRCAPEYRCLLSLLTTACNLVRPVMEKNQGGDKAITDMLASLKHAESRRELRGWPSCVPSVQQHLENQDRTKQGSGLSSLNETQRKAYDILRKQGPLVGKVLAKRVGISLSTLKRHVIPALRSFGVRNDHDKTGYYIK